MRIRPLAALLVLTASAASQQALSTTFGPLGGSTGAKVAVGSDMDGDGIADLLVTSYGTTSSSIYVVSGATNSVRQLTNPGTSTFPNNVLLGVPDLNLDGRGDIVVDVNGALRAYSGASLASLWTTPTGAYLNAAPVGDRNGDGRADLAAVTNTNPQELRVLSGADGLVLSVFAGQMGSGAYSLVNLGDLNGDGVPELAMGDNSAIQVLRLANPPVLLTIPFPGFHLTAANFAGDARNELLAGDAGGNGIIRILSATTGAVLRSWSDAWQGVCAVVGDLDADAVPDVAMKGNNQTGSSDVRFLSGANGRELTRWLPTAQFRPDVFAGGVDMNGDGFGDLLIGSTFANPNGFTQSNPGGWQRLSGKILATTTSQPQSCAQGPFFPVLGITRPMLGQPCTIAGQNAPANTVGFVAFSTQPAVPTSLGVVGCDAWFDLTSGALLYQPSSTNWQFTFPVPAIPQLAGAAVALQAFYAPTQSAIGIDVTNGIWARLGY